MKRQEMDIKGINNYRNLRKEKFKIGLLRMETGGRILQSSLWADRTAVTDTNQFLFKN